MSCCIVWPGSKFINYISITKVTECFRRIDVSLLVIFTRAARERTYSNDCGPLPKKNWAPVFCSVCFVGDDCSNKAELGASFFGLFAFPSGKHLLLGFSSSYSSPDGFPARASNNISPAKEKQTRRQLMLPCTFKFTSKIYAVRKFMVGKK